MDIIRLRIGLIIIAVLFICAANLLAAPKKLIIEASHELLNQEQHIVGNDTRMIEFAKRQWFVKSGHRHGPGPNSWSGSEQSVWVDENGWLHLRIREENGIWYCAEVYTKEPTVYGLHRFYTVSRLDNLDQNVVFAPFLYKDDQTEIDIEFSRWGEPNPSGNAQYVVQPWDNRGNLTRFLMVLDSDHTTHTINWQADSIRFQSIYGPDAGSPDAGRLIHEWFYTGDDIPREAKQLRVHINLWLHQGHPPSDGREVEVIVKTVDFPAL